MRKRIDTVSIKESAKKIVEKIDTLKKLQTILLEDIDKISNIYNGTDSSIIVSKYKERANSLTQIINCYENLYNYMLKITGAYQENIDVSLKNIGLEKIEAMVREGELNVQ